MPHLHNFCPISSNLRQHAYIFWKQKQSQLMSHEKVFLRFTLVLLADIDDSAMLNHYRVIASKIGKRLLV
jgi:hypothetical protein